MAQRSHDARNLVLFGHGNSGKTSLVDALALLTKVATRRGDSADGTSISNTEPEEKERKQTLTSHVFGFPLGSAALGLIDTPGHPDFLADAFSAMRVAETGVLCINSSSGLSFHARRLWGEAQRASLARAIVVTHVDGENVDFDELLDQVVGVLGDVVVPVTYPDASGPSFKAVHEVLKGEGPRADEFREKLEERVAESDDAILEAYLEKGSMPREDLVRNFTRAMVLGKVVPLFVVTPSRDLGLAAFVDAVRDLFPSPLAFGPRNAAAPGSESYSQLVEPDAEKPFAATVFKVIVDPYVGRISYLRCFRGAIKAEDGFLNVRTGKHQKTGGLLHPHGKELQPAPRIEAGDIFAVSKVEDLALGDTVTADGSPLQFQKPVYPSTTYGLAVTPKSRGDEGKINEGLEKLAAEDPTFRVHRSQETGEMIVEGLSPLHLDVHLHRLLRRYSVGTEHHKPKIPYKETITARAEGHHRHKKQSGGRGQFGEVYLRAAPRERGAGFEWVDKIVGGAIPRQFIPEAEKGVKKFLEKGGLAGCPVVDVSVEIYDGKFHDVDSDQISFQIAGERAFADAFMKAKPILLEPIMDVEIHVPERFTGDVAGNLSSMRGRLAGMEVHEGIQIIKAHVPLKEMQEYSTQLRSITAGEGSFTMTPAHYEPVPPNLQQEIVAAYRRAQEEHK
jgi:elongation factor G